MLYLLLPVMIIPQVHIEYGMLLWGGCNHLVKKVCGIIFLWELALYK